MVFLFVVDVFFANVERAEWQNFSKTAVKLHRKWEKYN